MQEKQHLQSKQEEKKSDKLGLVALICSFIPIIGFIIWLTYKDEYPGKANSALGAAVLGLILFSLFPYILRMNIW